MALKQDKLITPINPNKKEAFAGFLFVALSVFKQGMLFVFRQSAGEKLAKALPTRD
ncbi:MAG: hypothetical protein WA118_03850 [Carboxydocellales bacterium]